MESEAIEVAETQTIQQWREPESVPIEALIQRVRKIQEVQKRVMQEGRHYGKIPGVDKPSLLKPGAELLCMTFQLDPQFSATETRGDGDHLESVVTCTLYHAPTGRRLGSGIGSCSTKESKYAYRKAERTCPECGKASIIKGKSDYGGGWLCWGKKGGCGAKFGDFEKAITEQPTDRVPNPDVADQYNTVRKMACKRAHVAAVLFVTGASDLFTQDVEEMNLGAEPANSNGNGNGHGYGPSKEELAAVIQELNEAADIAQLKAVSAHHRGRSWTAAQKAQLTKTYNARSLHLQETLLETETDEYDRGNNPDNY